jgi:hypothetical protein
MRVYLRYVLLSQSFAFLDSFFFPDNGESKSCGSIKNFFQHSNDIIPLDLVKLTWLYNLFIFCGPSSAAMSELLIHQTQVATF